MRALLLSSSLWLVACGGGAATSVAAGTGASAAPRTASPARAAPAFRPLAESERRVVDRLVAVTSSVRGLAVRTPIDARVGSSAQIAAHLVADLDDEEIVELTDLYVTLDMLPEGADVVEMLSSVVDEQVVGFYDPKRDVLVIRDDVMAQLVRGDELDVESVVTISHEIIHALQGQHLALRTRMEEEHDTDFDNAYHGLVEGDATLGMLLVAARLSGARPADLLDAMPADLGLSLAAMASSSPDRLSSVPPIVRVGMTVPYAAGLTFCRAQYGTTGYRGVDAAHDRLPATTEQLLHPEKYASREPAVTLTLGAFPSLDAAGYVAVKEDTLGELELGVYLARGTRRDVDLEAAGGWGGDRVRLYRGPAGRAALWVVAFDDAGEADQAEAAFRATADRETMSVRSGAVLGFAHGPLASFRPEFEARVRELAMRVPSAGTP